MTRLPPSPLSHTRPQGTCDGVSPRKSRHLGATAGQAVALDRPPRSRAIWHDGRSRETCDRGFWQEAGFARIRAGDKRPHSGKCGWPAHATESLQRSSEPPFFGVATSARETPCGAASGSRLPTGRLREITSRLQEETGSREWLHDICGSDLRVCVQAMILPPEGMRVAESLASPVRHGHNNST